MCQKDRIPMHPDGGLFHGGAVGTVMEGGSVPYQQLQCYKGMKNDVAILLKRLRSRDMA